MTFFGIACFVISLFSGIYEFNAYGQVDEYGKTVVGLTFGIGVIFMIVGLSQSSTFRRTMRILHSRNQIDALLYDFENAGRAFGDSVILGDVFVIGKGTGAVIKYIDIRRVYEYIHTTNSIEDKRTFRAELSTGRTMDLFMLPRNGRGDEELNNVINYMRSRNSRIQVGYKGSRTW